LEIIHFRDLDVIVGSGLEIRGCTDNFVKITGEIAQ